MISLVDAAKGIYGAWRLAHGDRTGMAWFDTTETGFWRSFGAAIVAAPAFAALVALSAMDYPGEVNLAGVALVESIAYVIDWFAFPLAAITICRRLGKRDSYFRLIVALNWAQVVVSAVMVPAALVAGLMPGGPLALIPLVLFFAVMVYDWYVIRVALGVDARAAALVTLINLGISIVTSLWARALLF